MSTLVRAVTDEADALTRSKMRTQLVSPISEAPVEPKSTNSDDVEGR